MPEEQKKTKKQQSIDIKASINLVQLNFDFQLFAIVIKHEFCIMYNQRKSASLLNADEKQKTYYDSGNI